MSYDNFLRPTALQGRIAARAVTCERAERRTKGLANSGRRKETEQKMHTK